MIDLSGYVDRVGVRGELCAANDPTKQRCDVSKVAFGMFALRVIPFG
jgi:hypothetical protein